MYIYILYAGSTRHPGCHHHHQDDDITFLVTGFPINPYLPQSMGAG